MTISKFFDAVSKLQPNLSDYSDEHKLVCGVREVVLENLGINNAAEEEKEGIVVRLDRDNFAESLRLAAERYPDAEPFTDSLLVAYDIFNTVLESRGALGANASITSRPHADSHSKYNMTKADAIENETTPFWIQDLYYHRPCGSGAVHGGKKSRKLRKRTTIKGGKRKRRRTRRRR